MMLTRTWAAARVPRGGPWGPRPEEEGLLQVVYRRGQPMRRSRLAGAAVASSGMPCPKRARPPVCVCGGGAYLVQSAECGVRVACGAGDGPRGQARSSRRHEKAVPRRGDPGTAQKAIGTSDEDFR